MLELEAEYGAQTMFAMIVLSVICVLIIFCVGAMVRFVCKGILGFISGDRTVEWLLYRWIAKFGELVRYLHKDTGDKIYWYGRMGCRDNGHEVSGERVKHESQP